MSSIHKKLTNLTTLSVSGVVFSIGATLLIVSEFHDFKPGYIWIKSLFSNFGALLIASVSVALLWELFSKRAFFDELLSKTGLAEDIRTAGLSGVSTTPMRGPDFPKLINSTTNLNIFVCYANTWRANFEEDLKRLSTRGRCVIRLILPDPNNTTLMASLASRFGADSAETMKGRIMQAIEEYKSTFTANANRERDFSIWVHNEVPVTSFYRFDRHAVITLYKHAKGRGNVPTMVAERGGSLYTHIENEIDALTKGSDLQKPLAKRIFPTPKA